MVEALTARPTMPDYQHQACRMTLAQGIAEYRAGNPHLLQDRGISPEARAFFLSHDTAHVVFGCDTTLADEAAVKIASLFGTTAGFGVLRGYRLHESIRLYRQLRVVDILTTAVRAIVIVPRTTLRCRAQSKRWPWADFEPYMQTPLAELRDEFGIKVTHDLR